MTLAACAPCCSNPDENMQVSGADLLGKRRNGRGGGGKYQLNGVLPASDTYTNTAVSPILTNCTVEKSTLFFLVPVIHIVIFLINC